MHDYPPKGYFVVYQGWICRAGGLGCCTEVLPGA